MLLEQTQDVLAHVRGIVVRDDGLPRAFRQRDLARVRQRMGRVHEHHQLVLTEHDRTEPRLGRLEGEHAEVEAALCHLGADLSGRDSAHVDVHERMRFAKSLDERQHGVHRGLVGADQHAARAAGRGGP